MCHKLESKHSYSSQSQQKLEEASEEELCFLLWILKQSNLESTISFFGPLKILANIGFCKSPMK